MKHAINLYDLGTLKQEYPIVCDCMVIPVLSRDIVTVSKSRVDETGVTIQNGITEERWESIVEILRHGLGHFPGYPKHLLRIYASKTGNGGWKRV